MHVPPALPLQPARARPGGPPLGPDEASLAYGPSRGWTLRRRRGRARAAGLLRAATATAALAAVAIGSQAAAPGPAQAEVRSLDGSGNNHRHPSWGKAGIPYSRVAPASYADGIARMRSGPPARYLSNRIFNDSDQNLFSENGVTHWGFTWAQFLDHTFGLRVEGGERAPIPYDGRDPLESYSSSLGSLDFRRTQAAPGTGVSSPREQINTVSSYIDAWNVYGGSARRLEWLREGPVDGDMANNGARLLLTRDSLLPRAGARGDAARAPSMELVGRLAATPAKAVVAGDVRANENIALTALHTLFAREHNRIVGQLPRSLPEEARFQIARRVVSAEQQYITYTEFLPALGVRLSRYRGYDPGVDATLSNEFAVVGYRAHSMIHGEFEPSAPLGRYSSAELDALRGQGVEVALEPDAVELAIPLNLAFGNPDLLAQVGLEPLFAGLGAERQYRNDEQIDNQLRSVLFQVPRTGIDPSGCLDGPTLPSCFHGIVDLGAIDVERGRDHGMPSYNDLRRAYGLPPKRSFAAITGEGSESFPRDPQLDAADPIDDPDSLDFVELRDSAGRRIALESEAAEGEAVTGRRRTPLAARLKRIYGDVNRVDAFVGMISEAHEPTTEFGELQLAAWRRQFEALRDGDRFFYLADPELDRIAERYGISYRRSLADVVALNTALEPADLPGRVFKLPATPN